MAARLEIDNAIVRYKKAYKELWQLARNNPDVFPSGPIGCGSIAEYDVKKYLVRAHQGAVVRFGNSNQKGWDVEVALHDGNSIRYQIKSVSPFNMNRRTTNLVKGFDRLIVLSLGDYFVPDQAYLFEDSSIFFGSPKIRNLTTPIADSRRKTGSKVFHQYAIDIKDELLSAIE